MDISCIILSGDLELYVLGMLPEEDAYKIEQLSLLFPEVKEELDRISESLEGFANSASAMPTPSVKDGLMKKLGELKNEEQSKTVIRSINDKKNTLSPKDGLTSPRAVAMPRRSGQKQWLLAASIAGLVLSIAAVIYLRGQNKRSQSEIAVLEKRVEILHNDLSDQRQQALAYSQTMHMMQSAEFKKVRLTNLPDKPKGEAQLFWDTRNGDVYIAGVALQKPQAGKQYQLWAIVDGKPVDAGLMNDTSNLAHKMKTFPKADAFAISVENSGGSPVPTEVYMMGKI